MFVFTKEPIVKFVHNTLVNIDKKLVYLRFPIEVFKKKSFQSTPSTYAIRVRATNSDNEEQNIFNGKSSTVFRLIEKKELDFNKGKTFTYLGNIISSYIQNNYNVMVNFKSQPDIFVTSYFFHEVPVKTNVGLQIITFKCEVFKRFFDKNQITTVEKYVFKQPDHSFYVEVKPSSPIRENRDKDFLGPFTKEGNDAVYEFSFRLDPSYDGKFDTSYENVYKNLELILKDYDPLYRKEKYKKECAEKKSWRNRMLVNGYTKNTRFGIFTAIFPFLNHDLSGHTHLLSFKIQSHGEDGYGFQFCIFGIHFYYYNKWLTEKIKRLIVRNKPEWKKDMNWEEYYKILNKWARNHPFEYFVYSEWCAELGLSRADGLFWRREFNHGSRANWGWKLNPWRNRFWNLI